MQIPKLPGNPGDYGILYAYVVTVLIFIVFLLLLHTGQSRERAAEREDRKVERESFVLAIREIVDGVAIAMRENTKALHAFKSQAERFTATVANCPHSHPERTEEE